MTNPKVWERVQGAPLELALAIVAFIVGAGNVLGRLPTLSVFAVLLYVTIAAGGATTAAGRLRDKLNAESIGLVLMLGSYAFLTLRRLGRAEDAVDLTNAILNAGALSLGLLVRLYVVRKAVRARQLVGKAAFRGR